MSEVQIGFKTYKDLETLSLSKLEHILQLTQIAVDNYRVIYDKMPLKRQTSHGAAYLKRLTKERDKVQTEINNR